MAVAITAPDSQVVSRSGSIQLAWTAEYPQSAYEILYRRKGEEAWNTFGRVVSTANNAQLDLSTFDDFAEYHYRVVCYSDDTTAGTTIYSGSDSSAAYSLVVVPENRVATYKVRYGNKMVEVPIYGSVEDTGIHVALPSGERGVIPVGDVDSALASEIRVNAGGEVRAALGAAGDFEDTGVKAGAYMAVKERYSYSYANPNYTYSYLYSWTNPTYTYYYRYSWTNPTYKYTVSGSYTGPSYYYKYSNTTYSLKYSKTSYNYQSSAAYYGYNSYKYTYMTGVIPHYYGGIVGGTYDTYYYYILYYTGYIVYSYKNTKYYIPAKYATGYKYTTYYTTSTTYGYRQMAGAAVAYQYEATGGGGTSYGYRSATGGGGTSYGYRYATGDGGYAYGYGYKTQYRYA